MLSAIIATLAGLVLLVWSAERFITGAAALALRLGMSPMLVGLTLVALGTSAPEILVSAIAAVTDAPGLAVGNVLGSNIANIGLVLGLVLLFSPIPVRRRTLRQDMPGCVLVTLLAAALMLDGRLAQLDGALLLLTLVIILGLLWRFPDRAAPTSEELPPEANKLDTRKSWWLFISGLMVLVGSARLLVWGAVGLAQSLGVSDAIIGLTLVAVGTSLPELAASVVAARRQHTDMVMGNIIGSNVLNLLTVLPAPALLAPGLIGNDLVTRDTTAMLAITGVVAALVYRARGGALGRRSGFLLIALYAGYISWIGLGL